MLRADINLLAVFDAVARTGSVTAAAQALALSQPAVSHALNRLRDQVGDRLFTRSGRRLIATAHAEAMMGPARALLEQAAELLAPGSFAPASSQRRFRLAASDYSALTLAPRLAQALEHLSPGVTLEVVPVTGDTLHRLENGQIDVSFWGTAAPHGPFLHQHLFRERYFGVARQDHPLFGSGGTVTLAAYLAYPHVVTSMRDPGLNAVDQALAALGKARRVRLLTHGFLANIQCVRTSDLIATLPSRLCSGALLEGARRFALPLAIPDYGYGLVWHRRTDADQGLRWLRQRVAEAAQESA